MEKEFSFGTRFTFYSDDLTGVLRASEQCDFGFRTFESHLNDYDLFRDYAPCWDGAETNAHITAFFQRNPNGVF